VLAVPKGEAVLREQLEKRIEEDFPGRFSKATLKSTAQNINSTWEKAGLLSGGPKKIRRNARATAGSLVYALFLGYLRGERGEMMFRSEYARLLDCPYSAALVLAGEASAAGWMIFNRTGDVVEARFPKLISEREMEGAVD
jgi:hypothetical protein